MAETKTKPTAVSVDDYIDAVDDERKRDDSRVLVKIMSKIAGAKPKMWGPSIIGFGTYHYKYDSGHEGDAPVAGFSPRKAALTVYIMRGFAKDDDLIAKLGKHKATKGCLYIKKLDDVDVKVLEELVKQSVAFVKKTYPS
jgi:hypothetical protein